MVAVALVVADAGSPTTYDNDIKTLVEGLGHTVTLVSWQTALPVGTDVALNGHGPSSTGSEYAYYRELGVGLVVSVTASGSAITELRMADGRALSGTADVDITDSSHPLAAGKSGIVAVFTSSQQQVYSEFGFGPGVEHVASVQGLSGWRVVFAYDEGSTGRDAFVFPARRVHCGLLRNPDYQNLTADGEALIDAALVWAAAASDKLSTPTGFTFAKVDSEQEIVANCNPVTNATHYDLEWQEDDGAGGWTAKGTVQVADAAGGSWNLTGGVAWGTTYRGRVRAHDDTLALDDSDWSAWVETTTDEEPGIPGPANLVITPGWDDTVDEHTAVFDHDLVPTADSYSYYAQWNIEEHEASLAAATFLGNTATPPFTHQPVPAIEEGKVHAGWVVSVTTS